ncbi:MAG: UbiA-like polyprenyltransferase [Syntrophobacteraceae bacterium]
MWIQRIHAYGRLIKFSHTVFALPFALASVLLAHREHPVGWATLGWIIVAMAGARSAAMGFNRLVDFQVDIKNPRTASRPLTAGLIDKRSVLLLIAISSAAFVLSAYQLGTLCFVLSFPVLLVLFTYSYAKRFTMHCHLLLGFGIGLAPLGAWVAVTGTLDSRILLLALALMSYIAGFDILYACQDIDFDRQEALFSIPSRLGIQPALKISSLLHGVTFGSLLALAWAFHLGWTYLAFLGVISAILVAEHRIVTPERLENIPFAFFHLNSVVSVLLFLAILVDGWASR